ncbi:glycosyl hydrolase family 65 protein [Rhizobacter sp. LjRoot28]|uniref:glycosyl hydrolase family 65 protein n=1 Tax=Rhizobacter sp. LjRoot28 TaxID=3342309 RepID=UPI003ECCE71B
MLDAQRLTLDPAESRDASACALRCALGNGVVFMLSVPPEQAVLHPGPQRAAAYVTGRQLLALPQSLGLSWRHDGETDWFAPSMADGVEVTQRLLMADGALVREAVVEDAQGRRTAWSETRFVSLVHANLVMLRWEVTPLNWSGPILLRSQVALGMLGEAPGHWAHGLPLPQVSDVMTPDGLAVKVTCPDTGARWRLQVQLKTSGAPSRQAGRSHDSEATYQQRHVDLEAGATMVADLTLSITEETPDAEPAAAAPGPAFDQELQRQRAGWSSLWARVQVSLPNDADLERALRFHAFQLMQSVSPLSVGRGGGLPPWAARAKAGHRAWQEALVLPFFSLRLPALARDLLGHWHGQLSATTDVAAAAPARSAAALAAWRHHRAAHDMALLAGPGGALIVGAARCWMARATGGGLVRAGCLRHAAGLPAHMDDAHWQRLAERLQIEPDEPERWMEASRCLDIVSADPGVLPASPDAEVDMLTLLHLLGPVEASDLLRHASVAAPADWYERTVRHHTGRASEGDLASQAIAAGTWAAVDAEASWARFATALQAPAEAPDRGLPLCGMAATWDVLQRHYLGVEPDLHALRLHPCPPAALDDVALRVHLAGRWAVVGLDGRDIFVHAETGGPPLTVEFGGRRHEVADGATWSARCR